jgi:hypothetical protein
LADNRTHIVHSLKYDIQFLNAKAQRQEQSLGKLHHEHMAGILGEIFDVLCPGEEYFYKEKVEIDLGRIRSQDLIETFRVKLMAAIGNQLNNAITATDTAQQKTDARAVEENFYRLSPDIRNIHAIIFFLEHGYFNWQHSGSGASGIQKVYTEAAAQNVKMLAERLHTLFLSNRIAVQRFILQVRPGDQLLLYKELFKTRPALIRHIDDIDALPGLLLKDEKADQAIIRKLHLSLKSAFTQYFIQHKNKKSLGPFIEDTRHELRQLILLLFTNIQTSSQIMAADKTGNPVLQALLRIYKEFTISGTDKRVQKTAKEDIKQTPESSEADTQKNKKAISKKETSFLTDEETYIPAGEIKPETELSKGIMASNAGLIILWPYLTRLFKKFDLIGDGLFRGEEEQIRAMFMLNYLAGNGSETSEEVMLVPKILCGADLDMPLAAEHVLPDKTKQECRVLLQSVIENWSAIGATSVRGLQETFLRREALIKQKNDSWVFSFERKGTDVLIDRLPYGISLILFKWINYNIHVLW